MSTEEVPNTEIEEQVEEAEEPPEPNFICGVVLRMLPDGMGVNLMPIKDDPDFEREPTLDDLKVMGSQLADHISTINIQAKVLEGLKMAGVKLKMRGGGIIH